MNKGLVILFCILYSITYANASVKDSVAVQIDSSHVVQKKITEKLSEKYTGNEFDYDTMDGEAENFIVRGLNWVFQKLQDIFGVQISPAMATFLEFFFYFLIGLLVVYVFVKLLIGDSPTSIFTRKSTQVAPLNITEEHIESIDLDAYIKDALSQGNYRLAIRYMYLKNLKLLSLNNKIEWHYDKTNSDYYHEIKNSDLKSSFKRVSYLYDNIWYGEYELNKNGYKNALKDFESLTKQVADVR